jgi:hypothetical protein
MDFAIAVMVECAAGEVVEMGGVIQEIFIVVCVVL